MVRRTKEEALETRHKILDAAESVFHARGVARPSLADIAQEAGVTRGAIYWHFKNKSDVFAAMCDRVHLPIEALCDPERIARQEDPLGGIRDICAFVFRQTVTNPRWRRVYEILFHKCEMVQDNGAIYERNRQSHHEGLAKMREHLRLSMERGQLPADLDLDLAVNAFHAAIGGVLAHWLFAPEDFNLDGDAERLADVFIDTLRLSPALRKGYQPRPMGRLDQEMAVLCEAACPDAGPLGITPVTPLSPPATAPGTPASASHPAPPAGPDPR